MLSFKTTNYKLRQGLEVAKSVSWIRHWNKNTNKQDFLHSSYYNKGKYLACGERLLLWTECGSNEAEVQELLKAPTSS